MVEFAILVFYIFLPLVAMFFMCRRIEKLEEFVRSHKVHHSPDENRLQ